MRRLPLLLLLPAGGAGSARVDFDAAVKAGDVAAVVGHLDAGRDVEEGTPLLRAVAHRRVEVVQTLLARGADPDARGLDKRSPLAVAAPQSCSVNSTPSCVLTVRRATIPRNSLSARLRSTACAFMAPRGRPRRRRAFELNLLHWKREPLDNERRAPVLRRVRRRVAARLRV